MTFVFWNELLTRLNICYLCILTQTIILVISRFVFEGVNLVLIGPVLGHCLLVAFTIAKNLILYFHELGLVFLTLAGNIKRKRIIFRKAIE